MPSDSAGVHCQGHSRMSNAEIPKGPGRIDSVEFSSAIGAAPSPHEKAIAEAGRLMLLDAVVIGREFCKFMIGVASGAVPVYLGLAEWVRTGGKGLSRTDQLVTAAPVVMLLISSAVFAFGYLPIRGRFSLDVIEDIETQRSDAITKRHYSAVVGFLIFLAGVCSATIVVIRFAADISVN